VEPGQLALLATLFAITITDGLSEDESLSLGAFLVMVGDAIALIAAQQALIESTRH
jgi:hypothetical protein